MSVLLKIGRKESERNLSSMTYGKKVGVGRKSVVVHVDQTVRDVFTPFAGVGLHSGAL